MVIPNANDRALEIVREYISKHLDKTGAVGDLNICILSKGRNPQSLKYLVSSTPPDGMLYELAYDWHKDEWQLDAYKKFGKTVIKESEVQE